MNVREKKKPHYPLPTIIALLETGNVRATRSALEGAAAIGLDFQGVIAVVMKLKAEEFYKSMTTHSDHKVWQDVYHTSTESRLVYLKMTVIEEVVIISFKEL